MSHQPHLAPTQPQSQPHTGSSSDPSLPASDDIAIVAMLKAIWKEHSGDPDVRSAMHEALARGQLGPDEARAIEASAAFAVARKTRSAEAFSRVDDDPRLLEEAIYLKNMLDPSCLASQALDDILKDGKVTREEMKAFARAYLSSDDKRKLRSAASDEKEKRDAQAKSTAKSPASSRIFAIPSLAPRPSMGVRPPDRKD